jgi:hypothetical protein
VRLGGTLGNLGGFVDQTERVDTLAREPSIASYRDVLAPLLQGFVDLPTPVGSPRASCDSPAGGIAIGLGFSAVRASIVATAAGPMAGMCGSAAVR